MHIGKSFQFKDFIFWTRRSIYELLFTGTCSVLLYDVCDLKFVSLPWAVTALLGTATAFVVGFKNTQTYNRTWEARQIWGGILNVSRSFGIMVRDFIQESDQVKHIYNQHFAYLTALRYQMREPRIWENSMKSYNAEFSSKYYTIPEHTIPLEQELIKYMNTDQMMYILKTKNRAVQLLSEQSKFIASIYRSGSIDSLQFIELERQIKDLYDFQGRSERIKNFPYPRNFATINRYFVRLFSIILPFGMLKEFDKLNESVSGVLEGYMIWFVVPFSMLISWVYTSLDQVGESSENPFEGGANDVPISQLSRTIEIDMREMLGETDLPTAIQSENNIVV